jgi:hypothetical protein
MEQQAQLKDGTFYEEIGWNNSEALFVCVGLVGRNDSEPDCFYNLYKL